MTNKFIIKKIEERKGFYNDLDFDRLSPMRNFPLRPADADALLKVLTKFRSPTRGLEVEAEETPTEPQRTYSRAEILAPLREVFLAPNVIDEIVLKTSVPELLEGREASFPGVILQGPPGTGKTEVAKALANVYQRAGSYTEVLDLSKLNDMWVGSFARNLSEKLEAAVKQARKRGKPSFLWVDEGDTLAQRADEGAQGVTKHYQEAIAELKKYAGNVREIVLAFTTNADPDTFDQALVRDGRLTPVYIGYPGLEQRTAMWQHFARKYAVQSLSEEQARELGQLTDEKSGAFVELFCRAYTAFRRQRDAREKGYPTLVDALTFGYRGDERPATFDELCQDVRTQLQGYQSQQKRRIGFAIA